MPAAQEFIGHKWEGHEKRACHRIHLQPHAHPYATTHLVQEGGVFEVTVRVVLKLLVHVGEAVIGVFFHLVNQNVDYFGGLNLTFVKCQVVDIGASHKCSIYSRILPYEARPFRFSRLPQYIIG